MSWGELALPDDEGITVTLDTAQRHAWTAAGCSERGRQPASIPAADPVDITTRRAPSRWVAGVARQTLGRAVYVAPAVVSELDSPIPAGRAAATPVARPRTPWRCVAAGPAIALVALVACVVATRAAGVPIRDPKHVTLSRLLSAAGLVVGFAAVDAAIRACRRSRRRPSSRELRAAWRERWTAQRVLAVGVTLLSFFATY